ncbi:MAG: hypothetical protein IT181_16945, partial [Acidobacteria bacterium]|nr:hypothetical protein [Acidobacteriota bacterium]
MRFEKRLLGTMNRCYAAAHIVVDGRTRILLATEGEGPCLAWAGPAYDEPHVVWDGPGGTMSMVPVPGTNGEFLAVQLFLRMFQWEQAKIVHVRPLAGGRYAVSDLLHLPYIHRFDLLEAAGRLHFIGSTLADAKDAKDDWSRAGKVYVGEYAAGGPLDVHVLKDGITQNHGYSRLEPAVPGACPASLVTGREGAFEMTPPAGAGQAWSVRPLMDWPISDI